MIAMRRTSAPNTEGASRTQLVAWLGGAGSIILALAAFVGLAIDAPISLIPDVQTAYEWLAAGLAIFGIGVARSAAPFTSANIRSGTSELPKWYGYIVGSLAMFAGGTEALGLFDWAMIDGTGQALQWIQYGMGVLGLGFLGRALVRSSD